LISWHKDPRFLLLGAKKHRTARIFPWNAMFYGQIKMLPVSFLLFIQLQRLLYKKQKGSSTGKTTDSAGGFGRKNPLFAQDTPTRTVKNLAFLRARWYDKATMKQAAGAGT
jgi:hypothetical protein